MVTGETLEMKSLNELATLLSILVFLAVPFLTAVLPAHATDFSANSWTPMAPMPTARVNLGAAVVNGKIYAIGGINTNGYVGTNEEYDPATNTWTEKTPMPTPTCAFGVAVYQNKIYCIGGVDGVNDNGEIFSNATVVYDPATDTWETKTPMPTATGSMQANVVGDKIYVIGGVTDDWGPISSATEIYDPTTDTWTTGASIPTAVAYYASAVVNDKIYVISGTANLNQIYDPATNTWTSGAPIPTSVQLAAAGATTGVIAPQLIYVIGGVTSGGDGGVTLNQVYDPINDIWELGPSASMPTPRLGLSIAVVNDTLYALGGSTSQMAGPLSSLAVNQCYIPIGYVTVATPSPSQIASSPSPNPSQSPTATAPNQKITPFPTTIVAVVSVALAVVVVGSLLVYFKKWKR